MITPIPPRPSGSDPSSRFMQWVWESIQALRIQEVPGAVVSRTSRGIVLVPTARGGGAPTAAPGMRFRGEYVTSGDYVTGDVVVIRGGSSAGAYVCVQDNPGAANPPVLPDTGATYWVSIGRADTVGSWM